MLKHSNAISLTVLVVIIVLSAMMVGVAIYYQFAEKENDPDKLSYVACGCGCCSDTDQIVQCLYHSQGDDINDIADQDALIAGNPDCAYRGCSIPMIYTYCDNPSDAPDVISTNTAPVNQDQCTTQDDCHLVYTGKEDCPPCESSDPGYECLTLTETQQFVDDSVPADNDLACEECSLPQELYYCSCTGDSCNKINTCTLDSDCQTAEWGLSYSCNDGYCTL